MSPSASFVNDELQHPVVNDCLLVVLVVLLPEDGVVLGRLESEVVKHLQPKPFQTSRVGLEQVEVVPNGAEDVVVLGLFILVLYLDLGKHWFLYTLVGLLILYELVRNELPKRWHLGEPLLKQQLFLVLLLVLNMRIQDVFDQLLLP